MTAPVLTAIGSGKGGTGKTVLSTSLAHALSHSGERILLVDADLGLSNAAVHLGLGDSGDMPSALAGIKPLANAVASTPFGFDILAAPSGSGALANAGPLAAEQLCARLRTTKYDRVLIDLGAGVDATVMRFAAMSDEALLVMTPDPASLTDAYAFAKLMLKATGTRLPRVIVNLAAQGEAQRSFEAMAVTCRAFLKQKPVMIASVPYDRAVQAAVRRQHPLLATLPLTPAGRAILALAGRIAQERRTPPRRAAGMR